jgi:hypothetical protein
MKTHAGVELSGLNFTPRPLYPWEGAPGAHWVGCWVGFRAGFVTGLQKTISPIPGVQPRPFIL